MAPPTSSASNEAQQRRPYRWTLDLQGKHITKNTYHDKEYLSVVAATQLVLCVVQILFLSTLPRLTIIVTLCWPSTRFYSKMADKISTNLRMYSFSIIEVYYLKSFIMAKHRQLLMGRHRLHIQCSSKECDADVNVICTAAVYIYMSGTHEKHL